MKKILILIIVLFCFLMFKNDESYIDGESIRFRVIANSNSPRDILMKELVVDEVSSILFKNYNITNTRENIINNLSVIESKIDNLFINNDYDETYNIMYGMNEFPKKEYNGVVYEEGLYESLVVEIGDGLGNNYWCFLYPSLCMIDVNESNDDVIYKSKIMEIIDKIF